MNTIIKKRSLKELVLLSVSLLLVTLLALSSVLNFVSTQRYADEQLKRHSQDAATFLGLALSGQKNDQQHVAKERMIDAIFDSGDYRKIAFSLSDGNVMIERQQVLDIGGVPTWFVDSLSQGVQPGRAVVMDGWAQLGSIEVYGNPKLVAQKLWEQFKRQALLFAVILLLGLVLLYLLLKKLLAPLTALEVQAEHISQRSFEQLVDLPSTRELDSVARAINTMAAKLKRSFDEQLEDIERLRDQARKDQLTGLFNREGFDARLKSDLSERSITGVGELLLVSLNDFGQINVDFGRQEADVLLQDVAKVLRDEAAIHRGAYVARRTGAQFSVFIPGVSVDCSETLAKKLLAKIQSLPLLRQAMRDDWVNIGLAEVSDAETVSDLLSRADLALRQAQARGVSAWQRYVLETGEYVSKEVRQASHWQEILQNVLASNALILHEQEVCLIHEGRSLSHKQLLARIEVEGQLIVASTFLPMAKRFGLMVLFDEMIVERVFAHLSQSQTKDRYHITLSEASIADEVFMQWLMEHLREHQSILPRVTLEVPEHALGFGEQVLTKLCGLADRWGFKLCIDRFGISSISFSYLQRVSVSAIKIDASFIRGIHLNRENQFFLRSVVQIAHSQKIQVIAIGVETEEEMAALEQIGVDAVMGYIVSKPVLAKF